MTDLDASASNSGTAPATETEIAGDPVPVLAPLAGDPSMLGFPSIHRPVGSPWAWSWWAWCRPLP